MTNDFKFKVSVVIPSYNNYESFERTINSVLIQDYDDYEVVVTDDSSNDEIQNLINSLNNPKISYFKNPDRLGVPENWNLGLSKANGEYIKILHHDDWFMDEYSLGKFVKLLDENSDCDFGYSKSVDVDTVSGKIKKRKAEKYVNKLKKECFELFLNNRIGAPSVTIFRNKKHIFFDQNLTWVVDIDFYLQWLNITQNIAFACEDLINIGISPSQVTNACLNHKEVEIYEQFYLYDKYKEFLKDSKYLNSLKKMLKRFDVKDLDSLKAIVPSNIEIPEEMFSKVFSRQYRLF